MTSASHRPDPAGLRRRGRLRIYLGAAPGVGKTFAMLAEAHRRVERGTDVVVAIVETHGRPRTAQQLEGLEIVAPQVHSYRGTELREMDVDAVLARRPAVALVDELAHTNAPGSRHDKRWQDVHTLLDAGIDVLSTVNVQHLESLNDVVESITGIRQLETVPDSVVREAEQVELVDITPEALQRRMQHGNVYAPEKVDAALSNYFRPGNLTALRELALLWLADQVEVALDRYRAEHAITDPWEARERVVVAVSGEAESPTLVRRGRRIATKASAELVLVHVVRGDGLTGTTVPAMKEVRELAQSLDAALHTVTGDDVPSALLDFAREVGATQIVVGTRAASRWARIFDEDVASAVVRGAGKVDVHVVRYDRRSRFRPVVRVGRRGRWVLSWLAALVVPVVTTALLSLLDEHVKGDGRSAAYFVAVLAVALLGGIAPAIVTALLSGLLLNYYFTDPRFSFTIAQPENFLVTMVLLMVAVAVAALVDAAAARTRQAREASREAELLALFAGAVLRGADVPTLLEKVRETYRQTGVSLVRATDGASEVLGTAGTAPPLTHDDATTACDVDDGFALLTLGPRLRSRDRTVLTAVAGQTAALVTRRELAAEAAEATALAETDRMRRLLLSAVGHDLRTPIAAVKASVSSLRSPDIEFSPEDTAELLATIEESTDHLAALVANLLDSSRLAAGVVEPVLRTVFVDEVVHQAVEGLSVAAPRSVTARVRVDVGESTVLADEGLLERVLGNLIDNALRYAPDGDILVTAETEDDGRTAVAVVDHGPGMPDGDGHPARALPRLGDRHGGSGAGLGLTVVRGFVTAMGGTLDTGTTKGGGTTMTVRLPGGEGGHP